MKIRIRGNSLRFRLTRSEVAQLCNQGVFEERTAFNEALFSYGVRVSAETGELYASFSNNSIVLHIPRASLGNWSENDQVGFYHTQTLKNGQTLVLKLEKDFICMDETLEDQSDNYPNPRELK